MKRVYFLIVVVIAVFSIVIWRQNVASKNVTTAKYKFIVPHETNEPITPLPLTIDLDERKVALGERLFNDVQLSHDNSVSCATCHSLSNGGTDHLPQSVGIGNQKGSINSPTVFNTGYNFRQFWDGRAETLEEQTAEPIHNPLEMGSGMTEVISKLGKSSYYNKLFAEIYPDGLNGENLKDAIATFERSLITPNSRFDRYLRGETDILTDEEKKGYSLFKSYGCASCHQGIGVGGNLFQKFGIIGDYFADRGNITKADLGRFNVTGAEEDKYVFKVPSLRNVEQTPPYFHDASAAQLEDAVTVMSVYQLGRPITADETDAIVKFLKSLSGEYKGKSL